MLSSNDRPVRTVSKQREARFGFNTHGRMIHVPHRTAPGQPFRNITVIAAMEQDGGIGFNNAIPWGLSADMKHFASLTKGHAVIMGRKTWDSLNGKPLPNRSNYVVTNNPETAAAITCANRAMATGCANLVQAIRMAGDRQIFIIGGAQIYTDALAFDLVDELILTRINASFPHDVTFPKIDNVQYASMVFSQHTCDGISYAFEYWRRKRIETFYE
jgi:dihydrofolate reductase